MGLNELKIIVILMTLFKILLILNLFVFQIEENLFFFLEQFLSYILISNNKTFLFSPSLIPVEFSNSDKLSIVFMAICLLA